MSNTKFPSPSPFGERGLGQSMPLIQEVTPRGSSLRGRLRELAPVACAGAAAGIAVAVGLETQAQRRRKLEDERIALEALSSLQSINSRRRALSPTPVDGRHQHHPRRMSQDKYDERKKEKAREEQQRSERARSEESAEAAPPPPAVAEPAPTGQPRWVLPELFKDLFVGAVAEAAQVAALYPLDSLKVRCQLSQLSPLGELRNLTKAHGSLNCVKALYAGVGSSAAGSAIFGGLFMLTYQALYRRNKKFLGIPADTEDEDADLGTLGIAAALSSAMANCCTAVVEVPIDTARQQLQAGVSKGSMAALLARQLAGGPGVLYNGFAPFLLRTLPQDALQFTVYSQLSTLRSQEADDNEPPMATAAWDLLLGGIAGGTSALLTMPLDCIKTHVNCRPANSGGILTVAKYIWRTSGPAGFFAGVGPRLMERVPSCAVYWVAAEATRRVLDGPEEAQKAAQAGKAALTSGELATSGAAN